MNTFFCLLAFLSTIAVFSQDRNYELVWWDEFEGNGAINSDNWHHQTLLPNGGSWYNGEIQHYTDREVNSFVSNGTMKIVAKKETFTDQGVTKEYTSARLNSKFAFTYGKVEILAKLPEGAGTWPALWSLGQNITEPGGYWYDTHAAVPWPQCGEIDIMEHWGSNQNFVQSALHTPSSYGNTVNKGGQTIPTASDEFHLYVMEWTEDSIQFSVDGLVHYTYAPAVQNADTWPFDANQYLLLNVAILPEIEPGFTESAMEIDYVRIYQKEVLGISDFDAPDMMVYPNPANDTLNVNLGSPVPKGTRLEFRTLLGKKLYSEEIETAQIQMDVSKYPAGIYVLLLKSDNKSFSRLIVLK